MRSEDLEEAKGRGRERREKVSTGSTGLGWAGLGWAGR